MRISSAETAGGGTFRLKQSSKNSARVNDFLELIVKHTTEIVINLTVCKNLDRDSTCQYLTLTK